MRWETKKQKKEKKRNCNLRWPIMPFGAAVHFYSGKLHRYMCLISVFMDLAVPALSSADSFISAVNAVFKPEFLLLFGKLVLKMISDRYLNIIFIPYRFPLFCLQ